MICRACQGETTVIRTSKHAHEDVRQRECLACRERWETRERETPGSRQRARTAISSSRLAAVAQSASAPVADHLPNARASDGVSESSSLPLSDPERAREAGNHTEKFWTGWQWRQAFAAAWCRRYQRIAYGGGDADAKATGDISDQLAAMPEGEREEAERRAAEMFAEYLADESPGTVKARHPWSWFVQRFQGLLVPQRKPARSAYREIA